MEVLVMVACVFSTAYILGVSEYLVFFFIVFHLYEYFSQMVWYELEMISLLPDLLLEISIFWSLQHALGFMFLLWQL